MRPFQIFTILSTCLVILLTTACTGAPMQAPLPIQTITATMAAVAKVKQALPVTGTTQTPATATSAAGDIDYTNFDPANFDPTRSNIIDNPWLPLKPGTRFVYDGMAVNDSGELVTHRIVINVTSLTKMIGGVRALVTWDQDFSAGALAESELAFYTQDKAGNVWYAGEYPEAYENGKLIDAPTWIHGLKGAQAGIMMKANPQPGTASYTEGWGPEVGWNDTGQVDQVGQHICVKTGCYENVLVIAETSAKEGNAQQLKYYAKNVGNISVSWRGSAEKTKETLELTSIVQLSQDQMAEVTANALKLEKSAYANSKDVYGLTQPLEETNQ